MKSSFISVTAVLFLSLTSTAAFAKHASIGIYGVIDRVTFDRDGPSPDLVRISGVFVVPLPMSSGYYKSPQRGYLYFRIRPGMEQATRNDWNGLKSVAGTGQVVGFAQYWVPNPDDPYGNPHRALEMSVHSDSEAAAPSGYPLPNLKGIVLCGDEHDPDFEKIAAELHKALSH